MIRSVALAAVLLSLPALAAPEPFDVLKMPDGRRIRTEREWRDVARPAILDFFEKNVYGKLPPRPAKVEFVKAESGEDALDGLARRRQFRIVSTDECGSHSFDVLVYLPKAASGPCPAFVCPNFSGNHSVIDDPAVILPTCPPYRGEKADPAKRGWRPERIPMRDIVAAGFAIATFCHCDVYPDYTATKGKRHTDGAAESIWAIFSPRKRDFQLALTAWAWGDMRVMDLLETMPEIDASRVAVVGQSRLAKVAVIAAAFDARFALCCPNDGGCKSLALVPNLHFPAWFAPPLTNWTAIAKPGLSSSETAKLRGGLPPPPYDQASLIACIAPRPVHFGASSEDRYAPPDVHFASLRDAAPVWRLFGKNRIPGEDRMLVAEPFLGDISWHCKKGPHSITREDWAAYIADAKRLFAAKSSSCSGFMPPAPWMGLTRPASPALAELRDAANRRVLWFDTRPADAKIREKIGITVEDGAIAFDLRGAFKAGARAVRLRVAVPEPDVFSGRDVAFISHFSSDAKKSLPQMRAAPSGISGGAGWRQAALRNPPVFRPSSRRIAIETSIPVPPKTTQLCSDFEFLSPGDGVIRYHGTRFGNYEIFPSGPPPGEKPVETFHATFDGDLEALTPDGRVKPVLARGVRFADGRAGKAVKLTRKASRLAYACKGVVDPARGTVSFWMKPDWSGDATPGVSKETGKNITRGVFGLAPDIPRPGSGDGALSVFWNGASLGWNRHDLEAHAMRHAPKHVPYAPDEWHHYIFTWGERKCMLYRDGIPIPPGRIRDSSTPIRAVLERGQGYAFNEGWEKHFSRFFVGGAWNGGTVFDGYIDDFRAFSAPMTPYQAMEHYKAVGGVIEDWNGWTAPWRNPPGPPPPNAALLEPTGKDGLPVGMELVADVRPAELARAGDAKNFRSTGAWKTGTFDGQEYLEAGDKDGDRYAVRFRLDGRIGLFCFEVTYPDDKARTLDLVVANAADPRSDYSLQAGIETGLEHPVTGRNAVKRFLYWPRSDVPAGREGDLSLVAMTHGDGEPAALSRIRVFAIRSAALPSADVKSAAPVAGRVRRFALRFEDPAVIYDFGVSQDTPESAKLEIDRIAAYMKFIGADTFVYPGVWYAGVICDGYMSRTHVSHFMREFCRRFSRDGLSFYASINQQWFPEMDLRLTRRSLADGSLHATPISVLSNGFPNWGEWHFRPTYYNISHPDVQKALEEEVDALLAEGAEHDSFKGVCIDLFNSICVPWWSTIEAGYNDYSIDAFGKATGIRVPVDRTDPTRGRLYAEWLKKNALEKWIDWRCDVVTAFYARLAARIRAKRPDLELWVDASPPWRPDMVKRPDLRDPDVVDRMLKEAGIDAAKLATIPNLSFGVLSMPCWWRDELHKMDKGPAGARELVRDLPETPGMYAPARKTAYPFALLHDSYYESPIGASENGRERHRGDGRLGGGWLVEMPWRVTAFNASGREVLRPYAKALAHGDLLAFARGGFLIGTLGTESELVPFMRNFRALPAVMFADMPHGGPAAVRLRTAKVGGKTWLYALNTGFEPVRVPLPSGAVDAVTGAKLAKEIVLDGYELKSAVMP